MDEIHNIRAEIVNCKNKTKDPTSADVKFGELKESCSNKQKLVEVVLEHNSVLIREKSKHVVNPNNNPVSRNKITWNSQNHMGLDKSNGKKPEHAKTINNVRNNSEKLQTDRSNHGAKANKDLVIIVSD